MQRTLSLRQSLKQKLFIISLVVIATFASFAIYTAPSYAATYAEQKLVPPQEKLLTSEEKIERAYELGEGAGMLEEAKQASQNANTLTKPGDKMNIKTVTTPKTETNLVEKAKEFVEKVKS